MTTIQFIGTTPDDLIQEIKREIIPELRETAKRRIPTQRTYNLSHS